MNRKRLFLMMAGLMLVAGVVYAAGYSSAPVSADKEEEFMIISRGPSSGAALVNTKMEGVPPDASIDIFHDAINVTVEEIRKFPREDGALGLEFVVRYSIDTPTSFKVRMMAQDGTGKVARDRWWDHEILFRRQAPRIVR